LFDCQILVDLPHKDARHDILCSPLQKYTGSIPEWSSKEWKIIILEFGGRIPDEMGKLCF